jgi:hypothetical protein
MDRTLPSSVLACLLSAVATACVADPIATSPSSNPDVHVDVLLTHDGCTVYRFRDLGYHYYVRCGVGSPDPTVSTFTCRGKGCAGEDAIPTIAPSQL